VVLVFFRPQEWLIKPMAGIPVLVAVGGLALISTLAEQSARRSVGFARLPHWNLYWGLFVAVLMSQVMLFYFDGVVFAFETFGKIFVFAILLFYLLNTAPRLQILTRIVVVMGLLMAVHAILQYFTGRGFGGSPPLYDYRGKRSQFFGIFEDPNDLAQFLTACLPLCFGVFYRFDVKKLILCLVTMLVILVGWWTTQSRGGIISIAATIAMIPVFFLNGRLRSIYLIAMVVFGGAFGIVALGKNWIDSSSTGRVTNWGEANYAFKQNPIFGVGYGNISEYLNNMVVHNAFVETYAELGLFGYLFWFGLIIYSVVGCFEVNDLKAENETDVYLKRLARIFFCSLIGYLAGAYFLSRGLHHTFFIEISLCAGLFQVVNRRITPGDPPLFSRKYQLAALWLASTFGSIIIVYMSIILINKLR